MTVYDCLTKVVSSSLEATYANNSKVHSLNPQSTFGTYFLTNLFDLPTCVFAISSLSMAYLCQLIIF